MANSIFIPAVAISGASLVLMGCNKGFDCTPMKDETSCKKHNECAWVTMNGTPTNSTNATCFTSSVCESISTAHDCNKNQFCNWQQNGCKVGPKEVDCSNLPNCDTCTATECTKCNEHFVLDDATKTCDADQHDC